MYMVNSLIYMGNLAPVSLSCKLGSLNVYVIYVVELLHKFTWHICTILLGNFAGTMLRGKNAHYLLGRGTAQIYMKSIYYVTRHSYMVILQSYLRYFT